MIVILSWYSDGSSKPDISFVPPGSGFHARLIRAVASRSNKEFRVYDIGEQGIETLYSSDPTIEEKPEEQ